LQNFHSLSFRSRPFAGNFGLVIPDDFAHSSGAAADAATFLPYQVIFLDGLNGLSSNSLRSLVVSVQPNSQPQTFFGMIYTQNPSQSGDDLSAYHGLTLPEPTATMKKTASGVYLKGGDAITYTLLLINAT
jgi:hypothetical protein